MKQFLWALVVGGIVVFLLYGQRYEIAALPSDICRTARFDSGDAAHQPQYESRCQGTVLQLADCAVEPTGLLCVSAAADHGNPQGGKCL